MHSSKIVDIIAIITCLIASSIWDIFLLRLLSFILVVFELKKIWWTHAEIRRKRSLEVDITSSTNNVMKGSTHKITVMLPDSSMASNVYWTKDDNRLSQSEDGKYQIGSLLIPSLTITRFDFEDSGKYRCHVHNEMKSVSSNSVDLTCIEYLKIHISTSSENIAKGSKLVINCVISGKPLATRFSWYKVNNGGEEKVDSCINPGKYFGGTLDTPTLTVEDFMLSDEGKYFCKAENIAGETESYKIQLNCIEKPSFNEIFKREKDNKQEIECTLSHGRSRATSILWMKIPSGTVKTDDKSSGFSGGSLDYPSLIIDKMTEKHAGIYMCCAANEAGLVSSNELVVDHKLTPIEINEERDNYLRLVRFLMDIAVNVLQTYFSQRCKPQGSDIERYLTKKKDTIVHIYFLQNWKKEKCCKWNCSICTNSNFSQSKRFITKKQFFKLFAYDKTAKCSKLKGIHCCCTYKPLSLKYTSLDISLICYILLNYEEKKDHDIGVIDKLELIRKERNDVFHMSDYRSICQQAYETKWNTIDNAVTLIARAISEEKKQQVEQKISELKTAVQISKDDMAQNKTYELCYDYWRDKCGELEKQMAKEHAKALLSVDDDATSIDEKVDEIGKFTSKDGLYEIEICGNVAVKELFNSTIGRDKTILSEQQEIISSKRTEVDTVFSKSTDNNFEQGERYKTTSNKETKTIPVLFNIEVPEDFDIEKAIKAIEIMRNSTSDDDIKVKSYSLYDLHIIAEILKKRIPVMALEPAVGSFVQKIMEGFQNATTEKMSMKVSVLAPEKLRLNLTTKTERILKGSRHVINCEIIGNPKPTQIWWIKDDVERKGKDLASLVFNEFQLTDEGCYICYAANAAGTSYSDELTLECIEKPKVVIPSEKLQIIKGSNQIISCSVSGKPQPSTLSWTKRVNGNEHGEQTVDSTKEKYSGGTIDCPSLTIKDFDISDEGTYACQATNEAGDGCSDELQLLCIEKPIIEISSENQYVIRASDHTLACSVSGKPPPKKMSWIKRLNGVDTVISQTGKKYSGGTIDCPSLTINNFDMRDEGAYICQAMNDAGEGFSEALYLSCIEKPVVQISIVKEQAIKGSNQIITCTVSGKPQPTTLSWKKRMNGVETTVDISRKNYSGGTVKHPSLTIKDFDMSNEGIYTCQAKNDAGEGFSNELHLSCIEKPVIEISSENQNVIMGSDQTLTCLVSRKPQPNKMSWIKRVDGVDTPVDLTGAKYSGGTIDCPSLTIKNFAMSDEGTYTCQATNEAGEGFSEALYLSCIEQPTVQISIERQLVIKGSNEIITCKVSGKPLPTTLSWKKKTNGVETAVDLTGKSYSGGTVEHPTLTIKDFDMSNEGTYTCLATNEAGEGCSNELHLLCIEKSVIKISSENQQVIRGTDQTLTCSVSDRPPPTKMSWIKRVDGVETTVGHSGNKYSGGTIDCPSLTIKDFEMSDEGTYTCQATNEAGEGFSEALYLSCIEKPTVQISIERQHVIKGSNEIITCTVSGTRLPTTLSWKKKANGVETAVDLTGKNYSGGTVEHPSLTIKDFDMSNEGTYTCQATNEAGEGCSNELHLLCIEKPVVQISIGKQRVIKGSNQILSCSVFGKQQPTTLSWKKRVKGVETPIDLAETKYSGGTVDCPSLTINGIDMSDEGTYICKAKNEAGEGCSKELHLSCIDKTIELGNTTFDICDSFKLEFTGIDNAVICNNGKIVFHVRSINQLSVFDDKGKEQEKLNIHTDFSSATVKLETFGESCVALYKTEDKAPHSYIIIYDLETNQKKSNHKVSSHFQSFSVLENSFILTDSSPDLFIYDPDVKLICKRNLSFKGNIYLHTTEHTMYAVNNENTLIGFKHKDDYRFDKMFETELPNSEMISSCTTLKDNSLIVITLKAYIFKTTRPKDAKAEVIDLSNHGIRAPQIIYYNRKCGKLLICDAKEGVQHVLLFRECNM